MATMPESKMATMTEIEKEVEEHDITVLIADAVSSFQVRLKSS